MRSSRRALMSVVAIAVIAAACAAIASHRLMESTLQSAEVVAVTPLSRQVRTPREVCKSEEVKHLRPDLDSHEMHTGRGRPSEDTYTTTEEHCVTVFDLQKESLGYEVRYRLNGLEGDVHMDQAPGRTIILRDGVPLPEESPGRSPIRFRDLP